MTISLKSTMKAIKELLGEENIDEIMKKIEPEFPQQKPLPPQVPLIREWNKEAQQKRISFIKKNLSKDCNYLFGNKPVNNPEFLKGNIENYIGMTQVPTGLIGPLRINGIFAKGDFYIPMSTTEGALIASYHRGASIVSLSGGTTSVCLIEAVQRTPSFIFRNFEEAGLFIIWVMKQIKSFKKITMHNTSHGELQEIKTNIDGNQVTLILEFTTGDASGQNIVTRCTQAICNYIIETSPVKPQYWFVEGNLSGDKKATAISFTSVRGKKVTAEAVIKKQLVKEILHTSCERMMDYWKISILNGIQSGSIGVHGHYANALTAIFLACGQDVACIAEASVGTTRMDLTQNGDLYVCVTLPNLIVGTVGGGTRLHTQKECLEILECYGEGHAKKFAEICAAAVLCGEVSIVGAIAANEFAQAHERFSKKL